VRRPLLEVSDGVWTGFRWCNDARIVEDATSEVRLEVCRISRFEDDIPYGADVFHALTFSSGSGSISPLASLCVTRLPLTFVSFH
jgi:hypothetical protein